VPFLRTVKKCSINTAKKASNAIQQSSTETA
jgi:hypothetical protein